MEAEFSALYGRAPTIRVRCPGRVNIIGEHIDYNGYGVLPMAIEQDTVMIAALSEHAAIRIANTDEKYRSFSLDIPSEWAGAAPPQWYDYFLSGWKGVLNHLNLPQKGMDVLVSGSIPASSGLSSSSSVVCAAALTTLTLSTGNAFDRITREELAELCAESEKFVGTEGGGMDQAAEVLSIEGRALRINFDPLSSYPVQLPHNAKFVILHSGETLNKAATNQFNQRVVECRLAGKILLHKHNKTCASQRLSDVQDVFGLSLAEMVQLTDQLPTTATKHELQLLLGDDCVNQCLSENTRDLTVFTLRSRARHVYSEALRVQQMEDACRLSDLHRMGQLMDESHKSCSQDYECSCQKLDELAVQCKKAGALGVRLTGAGWGGCVVALVDSSEHIDFSHLNLLFSTRPSAGISYSLIESSQ